MAQQILALMGYGTESDDGSTVAGKYIRLELKSSMIIVLDVLQAKKVLLFSSKY